MIWRGRGGNVNFAVGEKKKYFFPLEVTSPSGGYRLTTPEGNSRQNQINNSRDERFDFIHQTITIFLYLIYHFAGCYCEVT